uniref:Integrase zinc-binding domain-containing protein n=1 Tax=Tanacetum cinerariifolium TaxID=118510 RepID=A0A699HMI4_TANCI|nr:hypothetical protein [Tanacetum cinerariifolium]
MLRRVRLLQANYIIREVHEGECGRHAEARYVVAKIMRQGYYWPSMHRDTNEVADKCDSFQIHAPVPGLSKTRLTFFTSPWPFYQWGLDILWMKAKPLAKTTDKEVQKFVWKNIVCRFGLLKVTLTGNETQLVNDPFKSWCEKWKIKYMNTAVAHPQANRLVERANKSLINGEIPSSLTYGNEAAIPTEIGMPTYQTIQFNEAQNEEEMRINLDLIEKRREPAAIREAKYKKKVERYYNKQVRLVSFRVGDFVYRRNEASRVKN